MLQRGGDVTVTVELDYNIKSINLTNPKNHVPYTSFIPFAEQRAALTM